MRPHVFPFSQSPVYYFTACTEGRRPVLACEVVYHTLEGVWTKSAGQDGWYVGRFVIMPDHVHFFAQPVMDAKPRGVWLQMWKSVTARTLTNALGLQPPIWQEDTFDHMLRDKNSYEEKGRYMRENPVRAGLCAAADDWAWQGEIFGLEVR